MNTLSQTLKTQLEAREEEFQVIMREINKSEKEFKKVKDEIPSTKSLEDLINQI